MGDRQPVTVKFEVIIDDRPSKSKLNPKILDGEPRIAAKKHVKFTDDTESISGKRNSLGSIPSQLPEGERTKTRSRFINPQMTKLSIAQQMQNSGLTPRNPRRCLSASNKSFSRLGEPDQATWIFPSSKSMNRDLTLIDLDLKVSDRKQYEIKEQLPPSVLPKKRSDFRLEVLNNRPRSSSQGQSITSILKKSSLSNDNNIHANLWNVESRVPDCEEQLSRPSLEPGRRSQEAFRQNYRRAVTPNTGYGKVTIGSISPSGLLNSEDSRESKSSNWGVPVARGPIRTPLPISQGHGLLNYTSSDKWSREMNSNTILPRNSEEYFSSKKLNLSHHTHSSGY